MQLFMSGLGKLRLYMQCATFSHSWISVVKCEWIFERASRRPHAFYMQYDETCTAMKKNCTGFLPDVAHVSPPIEQK